jgi:hypothetical protein
MSETLNITNYIKVGENNYGYAFWVGLLDRRWVGFAVGDIGGGNRGLFFLPGIEEDCYLGISDRDKCIRMTGAIAQSPEH